MIMNRFLQRLPRLSYRAKVAMLLVCGVVVGLGGLFLYLLRFHTYLGDDPSACVNCHIMTPYYATWMQKNIVATVEVNKPVTVDGWKIYQLSYDEAMGRWSETSTFELVKDPWLPAVYVGIYLLLAGAILTFITAQKRRR